MSVKFKAIVECGDWGGCEGCEKTADILVDPSDIRLDLNGQRIEDVDIRDLPEGWTYMSYTLRCPVCTKKERDR